MKTDITSATASDSQAPWPILARLELKNAISTVRKSAPTGASFH
jgi:hypothetical protein